MRILCFTYINVYIDKELEINTYFLLLYIYLFSVYNIDLTAHYKEMWLLTSAIVFIH